MITAIALTIGLGSALAGLAYFVGVPLLQHAAERRLYGGWTRQQLEEIERQQRAQRLAVAREQVRLQSEINRCLCELEVEIAQDRARRELEGR